MRLQRRRGEKDYTLKGKNLTLDTGAEGFAFYRAEGSRIFEEFGMQGVSKENYAYLTNRFLKLFAAIHRTKTHPKVHFGQQVKIHQGGPNSIATGRSVLAREIFVSHKLGSEQCARFIVSYENADGDSISGYEIPEKDHLGKQLILAATAFYGFAEVKEVGLLTPKISGWNIRARVSESALRGLDGEVEQAYITATGEFGEIWLPHDWQMRLVLAGT